MEAELCRLSLYCGLVEDNKPLNIRTVQNVMFYLDLALLKR